MRPRRWLGKTWRKKRTPCWKMTIEVETRPMSPPPGRGCIHLKDSKVTRYKVIWIWIRCIWYPKYIQCYRRNALKMSHFCIDSWEVKYVCDISKASFPSLTERRQITTRPSPPLILGWGSTPVCRYLATRR